MNNAMQIKPCQPYHAVLTNKTLLKMPDGKSAFKVYFISLLGRADPDRFAWDKGANSRPQFLERIKALNPAGAGFITAFTHITKLFRFDPGAETVLNVRAFKTPDLAPLDLKRAEEYTEFACYAEAAIAADEYRFWAEAATVAEYLENFSPFVQGKIISNTKLGDYFNS